MRVRAHASRKRYDVFFFFPSLISILGVSAESFFRARATKKKRITIAWRSGVTFRCIKTFITIRLIGVDGWQGKAN
ncbi:hypothetical protein BDP55DRAFT_434479 [Colletotrichum godetiae]|uniref:Uncharacterized protein n=1 Tax=Colletotrichum godetiae TaxID=1209918 RepID=A0AAJ0AUU2_9PEZI|nr:uncharacterized protein BDP55DRAFT_434479 [Colletotrichum godetiae]KAK1689255.1 hypothetical protein BDP55DRAFT_434479 [Colletotrichum godetiae]